MFLPYVLSEVIFLFRSLTTGSQVFALVVLLLSTHSHDPSSGWSPMFPLVVHQKASPSIWPAVQSLRQGLSTNPGVAMWVQLKR